MRIDTFNKHVKERLMNNIAVVVVNIQSPVSEEDDDIRFHQLYYRAKFIIEHFKYYHTEYGIDPNFIGVKHVE